MNKRIREVTGDSAGATSVPSAGALPAPYTGAYADGEHVLRHWVIAVVMWLLAAFLVVWFVVVAAMPTDHFLLEFCLVVALLAALVSVVAVWALRPRLIRDRQRSRKPAPPPALDALGRPPVERGEQPLDGELIIEASDDGRRVLTRGHP